MELVSRNGFPATRTICRKRTCVVATHHRLTLKWRPWREKLLWTSRTWDGIDSDYQAKDEEDAWDYAGEILGMRECYAAQARDLLEIARKAVNE